MTTLNIHAQESKSRFSCLSASDPETSLTSGKENKISIHYESTEVKQTVAARPKGGRTAPPKSKSERDVIYKRSIVDCP